MAKRTAYDILSKSIDDIKAGLWMCGTLDECKVVSAPAGPKTKHMACAVGLVSIHGKETKKEKLFVGYFKNGAEKFKTIAFATYPSNSDWAEPSLDALRLLVEARPNNELSNGTFELNDYLDNPSSISRLSDAVVSLNDRVINGDEKEALAWFRRARKLAKKRGL